MPEIINTYTKDGIKIGEIEKNKYYENTNSDKQPWIECVTCFVIDRANKKVLFEKRGKNQIDAGKIDLCSGHIRSNELPIQCMVRELNEELSISENESRNLRYLGSVGLDYSLAEDKGKKYPNLKCLTTVYALKIQDISKIKIDSEEVEKIRWVDFDDAISFIKCNMALFACGEHSKREFEKIFNQLRAYMFSPRQIARDKTYCEQ